MFPDAEHSALRYVRSERRPAARMGEQHEDLVAIQRQATLSAFEAVRDAIAALEAAAEEEED